jgi:NAD(P)H dehydrogenase (quinone)
MANFLDQAGGLLVRRVLNGKVGGAFASTATHMAGRK